jgi:hypothetical protein
MMRPILSFMFVVLCVGVTAFAQNEVYVSDFGWDAADSTSYAQAALNSGARRVVFDNRRGPWITKPLKACSNTEIVFEDGAELVAKKGEFHAIRDHLLEFHGVTNVSLVGLGQRGGTLRMHRSEYRKKPYIQSEWRHTLSMQGAADIRVENMSFVESGGDGICLGALKGGLNHCRNIVISRCVSDRNTRQGISVCSAVSLLIEDCVLKNTDGRLPKSGIDFEPNNAGESVANCVMRRCRIENNAATGIEIYLARQNSRSLPIGITVEDCVITGQGGNGINVGQIGEESTRYTNPPAGMIKFKNCLIANNACGSIRFGDKPAVFPLVFENCVVSNQAKGVSFIGRGWWSPMPDGIEFRNLTAKCAEGIDWFTPRPDGRGLNPNVPTNITGNITIERPNGMRESVVIDDAWCKEKFGLGDSRMPPNRIPKWPDESVCVVRDEKPGEMVRLAPIKPWRCGWRQLRYAFFADKPGLVHFRARYVHRSSGLFATNGLELCVGRGRYSRTAKRIAVLRPDEKSRTFTVDVPERGFYYIAGTAFGTPFLIEKSDVPMALDVHYMYMMVPPVSGAASLYLYVPENTESFAVISKKTQGVALRSPDGSLAGETKQTLGYAMIHKESPVSGLWHLDVESNERSCFIDITGVPGLLWLSREKTVSF